MRRFALAFLGTIAGAALVTAVVLAYIGAFTDDAHVWQGCAVSVFVTIIAGMAAACWLDVTS